MRAVRVHVHLLCVGRYTPARPQIVREFDAGSVGQLNVLRKTASAAIGKQTCWFGLEKMLAASASSGLALQFERPAEDVSGQIE